MPDARTWIHIKAHSVKRVCDDSDIWEIEIPATEIDAATRKNIEELLPDVADGFYKLMNKQTMLNSVASEHDVQLAREQQRARENNYVAALKPKAPKPTY